MRHSPLLRLQCAAATLDTLAARVLLTGKASSRLKKPLAQPRAMEDLLGRVNTNFTGSLLDSKFSWMRALRFVDILLAGGMQSAPLSTTPAGALSALQLVLSQAWLPPSPLTSSEVVEAGHILARLASSAGEPRVPAEGLSFDQWCALDPLAILLRASSTQPVACQLLEQHGWPAETLRPSGAKLSQWPPCAVQALATRASIDVQSRVWVCALTKGYRPPPVLDGMPTAHYFCGMDLRPGAPVLKAALDAGYDPWATNDDKQTALEAAIVALLPSGEDWAALLNHDLTLLDAPSSDGRTVYAVLMDAFRSKVLEESGQTPATAPAAFAVWDRARAYRRSQQLDEHLPAFRVNPAAAVRERF